MTRTSRGATTRELLRDALVDAAYILEAGDLGGLAQWCVDACTSQGGTSAAALVVTEDDDPAQTWTVTASADSVREMVELDLDLPAGPCRDCLGSGLATTVTDLAYPDPQWADFAAQARLQGFAWTHAQPLRVQGEVTGCLYLFGDTPGLSAELDIELAQALGILAVSLGAQEHTLERRTNEVAQLHVALDTRLVIEQAKGILAARHGIDVEDAFARLRKYARDHRVNIHTVARDVVENRVPDLS